MSSRGDFGKYSDEIFMVKEIFGKFLLFNYISIVLSNNMKDNNSNKNINSNFY